MNYPHHFLRSDYSYELPRDLIAQIPLEPRDHSKLMIVDRRTGRIDHGLFKDVESFLVAGDQLVLNDTKVIPARVSGRRKGGGEVELFFLKELAPYLWEVLAKPAKKLPVGSLVEISSSLQAIVIEDLGHGLKKVSCEGELSVMEALFRWGEIPLPPYIHREETRLQDRESYQTVYGEKLGAVAAPTAGLHFTKELIARIEGKGVEIIPVTLHVGLGTFQPLRVDDLREHKMQGERCEISEESAKRLNGGRGSGRRCCVGTTACRTIESMTGLDGLIQSGSFETTLFIYPGYQFQSTDLLLTNFHLPETTLLAMVSAFGGYELIREAYRVAVEKKYRFFSYGDAMAII